MISRKIMYRQKHIWKCFFRFKISNIKRDEEGGFKKKVAEEQRI
jgi:hypothetical protein